MIGSIRKVSLQKTQKLHQSQAGTNQSWTAQVWTCRGVKTGVKPWGGNKGGFGEACSIHVEACRPVRSSVMACSNKGSEGEE